MEMGEVVTAVRGEQILGSRHLQQLLTRFGARKLLCPHLSHWSAALFEEPPCIQGDHGRQRPCTCTLTPQAVG